MTVWEVEDQRGVFLGCESAEGGMMLRIELPLLSADMTAGRIDQWHKDVGDEVVYGDELLDVIVEDVTRVRRSGSARLEARRRRRSTKYRMLSGKHVRYRIVSLDTGVLTKIEALHNATVERGALLAFLSASAAPTSDAAIWGLARVAVTRVDLQGSDMEP